MIRRRSRLLRVLAVGVVIAGIVWSGCIASVILWGLKDEAATADAIVVMGAAQWDGRPSPVLRARLEHAHQLWKEGKARWVVVTGGVGTGDTTSEAVVGRRYLLRLGTPSEAVLLESEGRNTDESMRAVAALLRGRGLERVLLVSDPFHMLRLEVLARHYALEPLTSPTRSSPISRNIAELVTYTLGESVKVPWTLGSVAVSQTLNAQSR